MVINYESAIGLTIFLCLGYYLQTGPNVGDFLPQSKLDEFSQDGIVIVDDLFTQEELVNITEELMTRVREGWEIFSSLFYLEVQTGILLRKYCPTYL